MNGEEEAAFVDSFFLPGGILDPEDEEEEALEESQSALPENPWANEARPLHDESATVPPPGVDADRLLPLQMGINADGALGSPGPVGNASYDPTTLTPAGPLHTNDASDGFMRETLYENIIGSSNGQSLQSSIPSNSPSNNNGGSSLPFRPPPGFSHLSQQTVGRIIPEEPTQHDPLMQRPDEHDDDDDDDDSSRSVPHELYDRESLSASSLSGSSSVDESTITTPNTSSVLDDTPNTSAHFSMELQESRDELVVIEEKPHVAAKGDREDVAQKSVSKLPEETPRESASSQPVQVAPKQKALSQSPPVNKSRNRRGGKSKRNKNNSAIDNAKKSTTSVCVEPKKQTPYIEYVRASLDWTTGLLQHFLSILRSALQTVLTVLTSTATFWVLLLRACRKAVFTLIRAVFVLISFSILVGQNALVEATQEWKVVSYFATMYFTPHIMSLLMQYVVLPHWTPHVVACCIMYTMCRPPYMKRLLYYGDDDNARLRNLRVPSYTPAQSHDEQTGNMARTISKVILRQIRFNLPVVLFLEGFSLKIGTAMALGGPGRIVTAYIILMLRLGLLFSPMAWLCGAIQVLMVLYLYWVPLIDVLVVMVCLASVRFVKFLEQCNQAAKDIRAKEK